jgi:hypothetical protein
LVRPLDGSFTARVRETSLGLAALGVLTLLSLDQPLAMVASFAAGVGLAVLLWASCEVVGGLYAERRLRGRDALRAVAYYFGKYAAAAVVLWLLHRSGWLRPLAFTGGFSLPTTVVLLKAVGWLMLPDGADPAPPYSRYRKVGRLDDGNQLG